MKRSIVRRTNVDFCKRVEVWQGYRIIDRYLTIPGWKLEGFTAVNPRTDTPIFGKTWGNNYEGFLSNLAIQSPDKFPPEIAWRRYLDYFCRQRILPGPVIAKDYEEAMQYGEVSHHYELSIEGHTATVTFDKYYTFKLTSSDQDAEHRGPPTDGPQRPQTYRNQERHGDPGRDRQI